MADSPDDTLDALRALAAETAARAHVPYSGRPEAAVVLLSDGSWIPGVRVESASFSLTVAPVINALSTAVALGRHDVVAVVTSYDGRPEDVAMLSTTPAGTLGPLHDDVFVRTGVEALPRVAGRLSPLLDDVTIETPEQGVALARRVAKRAYVPESHFPVGCVVETDDGRFVPGVNVEHPDWSRILCAERNALGTLVSYGHAGARALYLSCPCDDGCSPCGACRQLIVELTSGIALWMDRGSAAPERVSPPDLLPGSFDGRALSRMEIPK